MRNFVTMAVMNAAYAAGKRPSQLVNADATTFGVSFGNTEQLATTISIKKERPDDAISRTEAESLSLFVKWMAVVNAQGEMGDHIFICADDTVKDGTFEKVWVQGLTHLTDPKAGGWLVFCPTRAGNAAMWSWWMVEVAAAFAKVECSPGLRASIVSSGL